jgi:transposase
VEEEYQMAVKVIGLDTAKNVFQVHGADASGRAVLRKRLRRAQIPDFFANLPKCVVGIEATQGPTISSSISGV